MQKKTAKKNTKLKKGEKYIHVNEMKEIEKKKEKVKDTYTTPTSKKKKEVRSHLLDLIIKNFTLFYFLFFRVISS